jgi:hypothetical protein
MISEGSKKEKKKRLGMLCTFWWRLWRERNKRVIENKQSSVLQVVRIVQEDNRI